MKKGRLGSTTGTGAQGRLPIQCFSPVPLGLPTLSSPAPQIMLQRWVIHVLGRSTRQTAKRKQERRGAPCLSPAGGIGMAERGPPSQSRLRCLKMRCLVKILRPFNVRVPFLQISRNNKKVGEGKDSQASSLTLVIDKNRKYCPCQKASSL